MEVALGEWHFWHLSADKNHHQIWGREGQCPNHQKVNVGHLVWWLPALRVDGDRQEAERAGRQIQLECKSYLSLSISNWSKLFTFCHTLHFNLSQFVTRVQTQVNIKDMKVKLTGSLRSANSNGIEFGRYAQSGGKWRWRNELWPQWIQRTFQFQSVFWSLRCRNVDFFPPDWSEEDNILEQN